MIIPDIRKFSETQLNMYVGIKNTIFKNIEYPEVVYSEDSKYVKNFHKPMLFKSNLEAKRKLPKHYKWCIIKLKNAYIQTRTDIHYRWVGENYIKKPYEEKICIGSKNSKESFKPDMKKVDAFLKYKKDEEDRWNAIRNEKQIQKSIINIRPIFHHNKKSKPFVFIDEECKYIVKDLTSNRWIKLPIDEPFLTKFKNKATVMRKEKCQEVIDELRQLSFKAGYSNLKLIIEETNIEKKG